MLIFDNPVNIYSRHDFAGSKEQLDRIDLDITSVIGSLISDVINFAISMLPFK